MKYLKYVVLVVSLAAMAFFLYARFWATDRALGFEGPGFIQTTADQTRMSVLVQNRLVHISGNQQIEGVVDLADLGKRVHGNFGYFPSGDLLLYHYNRDTAVLDDLAKFLRLRDTEQRPPSGAEGFYRCDLDSRHCDRWAPAMPAIGDHAFGLEIDPQTGEVYIAATAKFELYKYSSAGELLAKTSTGFKFPNTLKLDAGKLYVADTNNHRIKVVSPATENFAEEIASHTATVRESEHRWPSGIEKVDGNWWVLINDSTMGRGRILRFAPDWQQSTEIQLPEGAWPVGMAYFDEIAWVADLDNFSLYRFGADGTRLTDLTGSKWQELIADSAAQKAYYENIAFWSLILMVASLALGILGVALLDKEGLQKFKARKNSEFDPDDYVPLDFPSSKPLWFRPLKYKQMRITRWLMVATVPMLLVAFIFLHLHTEEDLGLSFNLIILGICLVSALLARLMFEISELQLGLTERSVLVKTMDGRVTERPFDQVRHTHAQIFVGDATVPLGHKNQPMFDNNAVEGFLRPRLDPEKKVSALTAFYWLLSKGDTMSYSILVMFVLALMIFGTEFTSGKT